MHNPPEVSLTPVLFDRTTTVLEQRVQLTHRTMFGCWSSLRMLISRIAVLGMPSSSASSLIFLSATSSPDTRLRALYTTPYVPSPIFSIFWYFSMPRGVGWLTQRWVTDAGEIFDLLPGYFRCYRTRVERRTDLEGPSFDARPTFAP